MLKLFKFKFYCSLLMLHVNALSFSVPNQKFFSQRQSCYATSVDFIPPSEGLASLSLPLSLMAAAPRFELDDKNGQWVDKCSASVISDSGKILTNAHCVEDCVFKAALYTQTDEGTVVNKEGLKDLICTAKINNVETKFKILAMSDCRDKVDAARLKYYPNKICNGLDYAVLQPLINTIALHCMKHNYEKLSADKKIATIGFPKETYRHVFVKTARDSDGLSQQMSFGKTLDFQPYCYLRNDSLGFFDSGKRPFAEKLAVFNKKMVNTGNVMQSSLDQINGSSGGPIFNDHGEIVGIVAYGLPGLNVNSDIRQCDGSTFFIPLSAIISDVKKRFPDLSLDQAFDCAQNAAVQ